MYFSKNWLFVVNVCYCEWCFMESSCLHTGFKYLLILLLHELFILGFISPLFKEYLWSLKTKQKYNWLIVSLSYIPGTFLSLSLHFLFPLHGLCFPLVPAYFLLLLLVFTQKPLSQWRFHLPPYLKFQPIPFSHCFSLEHMTIAYYIMCFLILKEDWRKKTMIKEREILKYI